MSSVSYNKFLFVHKTVEEKEMHRCRMPPAVVFQPLHPLFSSHALFHEEVLLHFLHRHLQQPSLSPYCLGLPFRTPLGTGTVMLYSRSGAVLEKVAMDTMSSPMSTCDLGLQMSSFFRARWKSLLRKA